MTRARYKVIVNHAGRLHKGIADRGADKLESAPQQIAAHGVGFYRPGGHLRQVSPAILFRLAADETPEVSVERRFALEPEERFGVLNGGGDLEPVAHDARVSK